MRKLFTYCLLITSVVVQAQFNPLQTQYVNNPMVINPASVGEIGYMSATLSGRKQWLGFDGAPETFVFTIHTPVKSLHHNVGILAAQDNLAVIHRTEISFAYAYRIVAPKFNLSAGVAPGVELFRNSWSEVATNAQGDAAFSANQQYQRLIVGYGIYFNSRTLFAGFSNRIAVKDAPTIKDQPLQFYSGVRFGNADKFQLTISTLVRTMIGGYSQVDGNVSCLLNNRLGFGVGYRHKEALIAMLNVKVNDQFTLGYAYDYSTSSLRNYSTGSHEILLRYDFGYSVERSNPRLR